jgi:3'-phosphoadenosine 5'-phosphosulfate sulfotransferase (PAPS reductase)/FAD synthetase
MKIIIFYSGGKDSQASMIWAVEKYGVEKCEAVFMDTGWENPVTYQHIIDTTKQIGIELKILKSKKYDGMIDLAKQKSRFPSTKARFCTEELKVKPAIDYVLSLNENVIVIEGIRKDESKARSKMQAECTYFKYYFEAYGKDKNGKNKFHTYRAKDVRDWCEKYNADKIRPIFEWSAQQTIDYIIAAGQSPNMLYYNGFTRVGCFPCIMARHGEVKRIIDNYPEKWEELQKAEKKLGSTFFPPDYIPAHSRSDGKISTAEDVKNYLIAKNSTLNMFEEETPSCLSAYNLCE